MNQTGHANYFGGVYPADMLPNKPLKNHGYIANTEPYGSTGLHWVAFFFPVNGIPEYFDSYGLPPINYYFQKFLQAESIHFSNIHIQASSSMNCALFCMYYICERWKGVPPSHVVSLFNEKNKYLNDIFIEKYINTAFNVEIDKYYDPDFLNMYNNK